MMRIFPLLGLLLLQCQSFYIYLQPQQPQCFYNGVYKDERLLIELETPIISLRHQIMVRVVHGNQTVYEEGIVNQAKITVPRATHYIGDQESQEDMEYQTCLSIVPDTSEETDKKEKKEEKEETENNQNNENSEKNKKNEKKENDSKQVSRSQSASPSAGVGSQDKLKNGYLLHVRLVTNFLHKVEESKVSAKTETSTLNYPQLSKLSQKLKYINSEQISLHQVNQVTQKMSQFYLQELKEKVIVFSMLEMLIVCCFTMLQVRMLRGYVNHLSIV